MTYNGKTIENLKIFKIIAAIAGTLTIFATIGGGINSFIAWQQSQFVEQEELDVLENYLKAEIKINRNNLNMISRTFYRIEINELENQIYDLTRKRRDTNLTPFEIESLNRAKVQKETLQDALNSLPAGTINIGDAIRDKHTGNP